MCQYSFSQTGIIKGHIQDTIENKGLAYANILITELNKGAGTNSKGDFIIENVPTGTYSIRISTLGYLDKVIKEVEVYNDSITKLDILFPPYCKYNQSNKECPVCGKKDKVIPIIYGLPTIKIGRKAEKGKLIIAGCEITGCDPTWYCKRDEKEF